MGKKDSETNQKRKENEHRYDFDLGSKQKKLIGKVAPPQQPRRSSRFLLASACRGFWKKISTPTGAKGTAAKPFDGDALTARRMHSRQRGWQRRHRRRLQVKQRRSGRVGEQRARPRLSLTLSVTAGSGKEGERARMETQVHGVWLDAVTGGRRGPNPPHPKAAFIIVLLQEICQLVTFS